MVIIRFQGGAEWFNPNWMFRQLLEDVVEIFPEDAELRFSMEKAEAFGALFLDSMDQILASRILLAISTVAERTVKGKLQGWVKTRPTDKDGQRMYLEALSELLDAINHQGANKDRHAPIE